MERLANVKKVEVSMFKEIFNYNSPEFNERFKHFMSDTWELIIKAPELWYWAEEDDSYILALKRDWEMTQYAMQYYWEVYGYDVPQLGCWDINVRIPKNLLSTFIW